MDFEPTADKKSLKANLNITVHVVGKSGTQNELLATFLEENMGVLCERHLEISRS